MKTGNTNLDTVLKSDNGVEIPRHVKKVMLEMQEKSGNTPDLSVFERDIKASEEQGGFIWGDNMDYITSDGKKQTLNWGAAMFFGDFSSFDFLLNLDPWSGLKAQFEYTLDDYRKVREDYLEQKMKILAEQENLKSIKSRYDDIYKKLIELINNA